MIDAKDLRIGNLTWWTKEDDETERQVHVIGVHSFDNAPFLDPIPLTPEILEAAGFEKSSKSNTVGEGYFWNGPFVIVEARNGYELFGSEWTIGETFHYLHELQNISKDLFKNELTVTLTPSLSH